MKNDQVKKAINVSSVVFFKLIIKSHIYEKERSVYILWSKVARKILSIDFETHILLAPVSKYLRHQPIILRREGR